MKRHCEWCKRLINGRMVRYRVDYIYPPHGSVVLCKQCYERLEKSRMTYDETRELSQMKDRIYRQMPDEVF